MERILESCKLNNYLLDKFKNFVYSFGLFNAASTSILKVTNLKPKSSTLSVNSEFNICIFLY